MFSIKEYIKKHRIALGESIKDRQKIYLDIKYWSWLCDVSLGLNTDDTLVKVHNQLMQLAKEKKIICPLSYRIYSELLKQKDIKRLKETAKIMDILSGGVMIISEDERVDYELLYFLYTHIKGKDSIYEPNVFVWTKALFLMGPVIPDYLPMISDQENEFIQKEFFKTMWEYTFTELINKMGKEINTEILQIAKNTVDAINIDKVKFEHENKTSQQMYMSEMGGQLDAYRGIIKCTFSKFATNMNQSTEEIGNKPEDNIQPILNMIYNIFKQDKMGTYLPTFDIRARAHATMRWNKTRKFQANDLDDIGHIFTALPYCDYFFTERSFNALIKEVKYDEKYSCDVAYKPEEILSIIKSI